MVYGIIIYIFLEKVIIEAALYLLELQMQMAFQASQYAFKKPPSRHPQVSPDEFQATLDTIQVPPDIVRCLLESQTFPTR